ncbi:MAG TPA: TIGR03619 family F420-dependent LLM class oxidoreductase [Actinomycetes bacterium]|jgi:alkanesulfonate monooxygenase|nr:TIGR03619 family F420-dependent LLM class oxidoreductase [Actinomycetes bacterium]
MRFGVWIPSYCYPNLDYERARREVGDFARKANDLGLDLWVIDHLLHAPGLYGMPWLEPMSVITYAAALAPDVQVGTGILVLPLRHPVILAKEVATLDYLTGGRFILGVGPGWYPDEYRALGNRIEERGARTDEILEALRRLLSEQAVTFEGRYYRFEDVTIEPRPPRMPQLWVSGGSRIPDPEYHDVPVLAPTVLRRILSADAWLSRCSGNQELVKRDWEQIRRALVEQGRTPDSLLFAHTNFTYVVDTADRDAALEAQRPYFEQVMGTHRSFEHLQQCYLLGSVDDIVERLKDLEQAGLQYAVLGPTADELGQLDLIAERIAPAFA